MPEPGSIQARKTRFREPGRLAALFITLLLVSACSGKPHVLRQTDIEIQGSHEIYIVRQKLHTGFVLPVHSIRSHLPQVVDQSGGSDYLEFGWGDRVYYQSEQNTFGMALKALFWPSDSVVRVVEVPEKPDIHFEDFEVETLCLDQEQYALLLAFIEQSFLRDSEGQIIKSSGSPEGDSQFYRAEGDYYLWNTCNNWTARGLKSAGQGISPAFKITAGSVMAYLAKQKDENVGACQQSELPGMTGAEGF